MRLTSSRMRPGRGAMTATRNLSEEEIQSRILHRDAMMLVLNKPAGIAVHATGHDKIALDQSFKYLQFGGLVEDQHHRITMQDAAGDFVFGEVAGGGHPHPLASFPEFA